MMRVRISEFSEPACLTFIIAMMENRLRNWRSESVLKGGSNSW